MMMRRKKRRERERRKSEGIYAGGVLNQTAKDYIHTRRHYGLNGAAGSGIAKGR